MATTYKNMTGPKCGGRVIMYFRDILYPEDDIFKCEICHTKTKRYSVVDKVVTHPITKGKHTIQIKRRD